MIQYHTSPKLENSVCVSVKVGALHLLWSSRIPSISRKMEDVSQAQMLHPGRLEESVRRCYRTVENVGVAGRTGVQLTNLISLLAE